MREMQLTIDAEGTIRHIASDAAPRFEGEVTKRRASNVLPFDPIKRLAFRALRRMFGDTGRISDWTRTWKGPQIVFIVDGPVLGPYPDRATALEREVQWLLRERF